MRKQQRNQLRVNESLMKDIKDAAEDAKKLNMMSQTGQRIKDETNNQILALKSNNEERKQRFECQIKALQDRLKEKDDPIDASNKENN